MKKIITVLLLILTINVNASTKTYERTDEDLRINDWITVTDENKDNILNTPSVLETEKIYDFADLFNEDEENKLFELVNSYIETYLMDLVIVTTNKNNESSQVYADDFYDYNNFGIGNNRAGLLLLIDMDNREIYISTSGEAILLYNDARIDDILDEMTYYARDEKYFEAIKSGIEEASSFADEGIPEDNRDSYIDEDGNYVYVETEPERHYPLVIFLIISASLATVVLIIFVSKNKLVRKAYEAKTYMDEKTKKINNLGDKFLTSQTTRIKIVSNTTGGGGSSTHSSSSGASHGGGGRSF